MIMVHCYPSFDESEKSGAVAVWEEYALTTNEIYSVLYPMMIENRRSG
jgi:hypothetical protein